MSIWSIVVAAGSGTRFGGPKQLAPLAGRRVIDWSVETARATCDYVIVVVPGDLVTSVAETLTPDTPGVSVVAGGATRSDSVRCGLAEVPEDASVVVVHDGARPMANEQIFTTVIDAIAQGADASIPVVPVTDTIRQVSGGVVDRSTLVAVQTPQAFAAATLRAAHQQSAEATDDAGLVEAIGGKVVHVAGNPENLKITNPSDLAMAEAILADRQDQSSEETS